MVDQRSDTACRWLFENVLACVESRIGTIEICSLPLTPEQRLRVHITRRETGRDSFIRKTRTL